MNGGALRRWGVAAVIVAVVATACTTSRGNKAANTTGPSSASSQGEALGQGVTAGTIKIGFSYIDLEALAKTGIIKIDHGPYEQIITALIDDLNKRGGINGRQVELVTAKFSAIGNTDQLAACTKFTEDDKVFAVLNGFLGNNDLCVVQQHQTILIGGTSSDAQHAQARAPWVTWDPSAERSIDALVRALGEAGDLKGHTIAVYAAQAAYKPLLDVGAKALKDAGYKVADVAFNDAPDNDVQAAAAQDKVIAQRMTSERVDTVVDVGQFIPGADFDAAGFHPRLYSTSVGNIAAAVFTNPLGKFPLVAGLAAPGAELSDPAMQRCVQVWKQATGKDIVGPEQEDLQGRSSGYVAMQIACSSLDLFTAAAKAAGKNLNNETFAKGLATLSHIDLPDAPDASFGPDKFDGQDRFQLQKLDPTWKQGSGKPQFVDVGPAFTLTR